jgi:hypothetical protein
MRHTYIPLGRWRFPAPSDASEQKNPGLGSSLDPIANPEDLLTMVNSCKFQGQYDKLVLFPEDVAKGLEKHQHVLAKTVERIDAVWDNDLTATSDASKILRGKIIKLLFVYIQCLWEAASLEYKGLETAFRTKF